MLFELQLKKLVQDLFPQLFNKEVDEKQLLFQPTRKEFEGDITLVVFNLGQAGRIIARRYRQENWRCFGC